MKKYLLLVVVLSLPGALLLAQTTTDGLMMHKKDLCTGFMYTYDRWEDYWEGTRKRDNLNIGKVTTQSLMWVGVYGVTDKINVIAMVPYVWTKASLGTMRGMEGVQDLMLSVKYHFFKKEMEGVTLSTFAVGSFSTPLTDYTPDFLPLSIGLASTTAGGRLTANATIMKNWYINGSGAYTWRSNVSLDRSSYYTDGQFYMTDEVKMPNVFDYFISAGYLKGGVQAELFFTQQHTLGGGDIRRQDMPFVSNKMNFSRAGALVMYYLPKPKGLAARSSISHTVAGRNVGQSTTLMGGLLYTIHFSKQQ